MRFKKPQPTGGIHFMVQPTNTPAPINNAPAQNDDYLTLCVSINKDLPATPGDKVASRIFKFKDDGIPESFMLWVEYQEQKENHEFLKWKVAKGLGTLLETEDLYSVLMEWNGKEDMIVQKHIDGNNIVPAADLPDKPQWRVLIKVDREQPPIAKPWEEKKSTSATEPVKPNPEQISLIQIAQAQIAEGQITLAHVVPPAASGPPNPVVPSPDTLPQNDKKSEPILIRLNAELTFDTEKYAIYGYHKWPKGIKKSKDEIKRIIYKALSKGDGDAIQYFISNRYISTNRLRLDEITEGEWLLPVYIKGESNKKVLLTYIKVKIEWKAEDTKSAAITPKKDTGSADAGSAKDPGKDSPQAK